MNIRDIQGGFPLALTGLIALLSKQLCILEQLSLCLSFLIYKMGIIRVIVTLQGSWEYVIMTGSNMWEALNEYWLYYKLELWLFPKKKAFFEQVWETLS